MADYGHAPTPSETSSDAPLWVVRDQSVTDGGIGESTARRSIREHPT